MADVDTQDDQNDYGTWLPQPIVDEKSEQAERLYFKASIPVIQEVLDWYDECIAEFSKPEVITGVNVSTDAETVKNAVLYAQQQVAGYRKKKAEFVHRFNDYISEGDAGQEE